MVNTSISTQHSCCFIHLDEDAHENTSHCAHFTSKHVKTEMFEVGETLFYSKDGFSTMAKVSKIFLDDNNVMQISVTTADGTEIQTTREHLRSPGNPDVGWIPSSAPEYNQSASQLTEEQVNNIISPSHLSPLQQEFLSLHCKLLHLPFSVMLRMSKIGILPRRFLKLRNNLPPCTSCLFGQAHRRPWQHKSSSSTSGGVLRGPAVSEPGQTVGVDQMVSAQPGIVPQEKGSMTRARIWGATVFVDYATKFVKVHLMQNATGEETLAAKNSFEQACSSRGVSPRHYHADNGQFAESLFTSDCK